jgi:hypothetical protein
MTGSPGAPLNKPQPSAGVFLLAHPEYWFEPPFDKTQSVLDAKGGPQDLLSDFSLIAINPHFASNNPIQNQRPVILLAYPEYWFEPPFDKTQSVLDAKGGLQDLSSDFSLITINPSECLR